MASDARKLEGYVTVRDGLRLHFNDYAGPANRPPLLCLHGLTRNARDFTDFAERYASRRRVISLDFRGRGGSDYDPLPMRYNPLTYASDVIELLDNLTIGEAVFVGTSLGGLVTMAVAARHLGRIAGTILNDVGPELSAHGLERIRSYLGQDTRFASWEAAAQAIAANQGHIPASYSIDDWLRVAEHVCREEAGEIRFDYDMQIALPFQVQGAAPSVDLWPLFKQLARKPLLVVRGELSDLLSPAALKKMHAAAPHMKSVTVPGVGHPPTLDEPASVAAIDAFVEQDVA